ncbi:MAG: amino acid permease [Conexibacter sp.]|jgi:amino acid transporter|nr:amino acid permease [Conexibacter sp.]MCZ4492385.1 amino acid permease [Conexibacter sp.]
MHDQQQLAADTARLEELGYKQRLTRRLGLFSNFAVGFTYLSPVVGVYGLFAYGLATGGPAFIWALPIVFLGQFLVTLVFAEVASEYPIAGGIYQWTRNLVSERYAWFAGWMYLWALLINIAAGVGASTLFLGPLFGYDVTRASTVFTTIALLAVGGIINFAGVRGVSLVSRLGVFVEIGGTAVLAVILLATYRHNPVSSIFDNLQVQGSHSYTGAFLAACLFGVWCLYGHESAGDVAEEVIDPSSRVPKAMLLAIVVGAGACLLITFSLILSVPNLGAVISGKDTNPILTVLNGALGSFGAKLALIMVLIGFASCCLSAQAAATRLVYSYSRDGMIMGSRFLSRVSDRFHTPPWAVLVVFVVPSLVSLMPTATISRVIAFAVIGNYLAFLSVVVATIVARSRGWQPAGKFRLGRFGWPVAIGAVAYQIATIVILSIKTPPLGSGFFDRWFVPISAGIVIGIGALYYVIARPKRRVQDGQSGAGDPLLDPSVQPVAAASYD